MEPSLEPQPNQLRFRPCATRPLDFGQLLKALAGRPVNIDMMGFSQGHSKPVRVWGSITFDHEFEFFALVRGGVLRPEMLPNASFALDRNVVSALRLWHEGRAGGPPLGAMIRWLNRPGMSSSPFLAALEGGVKKLPTFEEYSKDLDEIEAVTRAALPDIDLLDSRQDGRREFVYETCLS